MSNEQHPFHEAEEEVDVEVEEEESADGAQDDEQYEQQHQHQHNKPQAKSEEEEQQQEDEEDDEDQQGKLEEEDEEEQLHEEEEEAEQEEEEQHEEGGEESAELSGSGVDDDKYAELLSTVTSNLKVKQEISNGQSMKDHKDDEDDGSDFADQVDALLGALQAQTQNAAAQRSRPLPQPPASGAKQSQDHDNRKRKTENLDESSSTQSTTNSEKLSHKQAKTKEHMTPGKPIPSPAASIDTAFAAAAASFPSSSPSAPLADDDILSALLARTQRLGVKVLPALPQSKDSGIKPSSFKSSLATSTDTDSKKAAAVAVNSEISVEVKAKDLPAPQLAVEKVAPPNKSTDHFISAAFPGVAGSGTSANLQLQALLNSLSSAPASSSSASSFLPTFAAANTSAVVSAPAGPSISSSDKSSALSSAASQLSSYISDIDLKQSRILSDFELEVQSYRSQIDSTNDLSTKLFLENQFEKEKKHLQDKLKSYKLSKINNFKIEICQKHKISIKELEEWIENEEKQKRNLQPKKNNKKTPEKKVNETAPLEKEIERHRLNAVLELEVQKEVDARTKKHHTKNTKEKEKEKEKDKMKEKENEKVQTKKMRNKVEEQLRNIDEQIEKKRQENKQAKVNSISELLNTRPTSALPSKSVLLPSSTAGTPAVSSSSLASASNTSLTASISSVQSVYSTVASLPSNPLSAAFASANSALFDETLLRKAVSAFSDTIQLLESKSSELKSLLNVFHDALKNPARQSSLPINFTSNPLATAVMNFSSPSRDSGLSPLASQSQALLNSLSESSLDRLSVSPQLSAEDAKLINQMLAAQPNAMSVARKPKVLVKSASASAASSSASRKRGTHAASKPAKGKSQKKKKASKSPRALSARTAQSKKKSSSQAPTSSSSLSTSLAALETAIADAADHFGKKPRPKSAVLPIAAASAVPASAGHRKGMSLRDMREADILAAKEKAKIRERRSIGGVNESFSAKVSQPQQQPQSQPPSARQRVSTPASSGSLFTQSHATVQESTPLRRSTLPASARAAPSSASSSASTSASSFASAALFKPTISSANRSAANISAALRKPGDVFDSRAKAVREADRKKPLARKQTDGMLQLNGGAEYVGGRGDEDLLKKLQDLQRQMQVLDDDDSHDDDGQ